MQGDGNLAVDGSAKELCQLKYSNSRCQTASDYEYSSEEGPLLRV